MRRRGLIALALCLLPGTAAAESTKTTPTPAITHIHRWNVSVRGALQDYHVLLVDLTSTEQRFAVSKQADRNHTVSWYGTNYGALVAVNASFFSFADREPSGPTQSDGTFWTNATVGARTSVAFGPGRAAIFDNGGTSAKGPWPAVASFANNGVSGQPWLIRDGKQTGPWTEPASINSRNARTAVGLTGTGRTLIIVTVDAGRAGAQGMTGSDLLLVFGEFLAVQALNLDGTGSTALWIGKEGGLKNTPSELGKERSVSNALMILPSIVPPIDAGVDASADTAADTAAGDTPVSDVVSDDTGSTGPEDPTGDAGEVADSAIYEVPEGDHGLPSSPAGDASGCACTTPNARRATPFAGIALAIALALRRAKRRRA